MTRIARQTVIMVALTASGTAFGQEAAPAAAAPEAPAAVAPAAAPASAVTSEASKESAEEPFGKAGVINIASDLSLNVQHTGYSAPSGGEAPSSVTTYVVGPAADYFVIDNLSLGAMFQFGRIAESVGAEEVKVDVVTVEPRVGYHIPLVPEKFGLWPRVSFFYESKKFMVDGRADITEKSMGIGVFVPLLIHPVEHFHIGIGPYMDTALSTKLGGQDDAKATTIGLRMEIAGWWKL